MKKNYAVLLKHVLMSTSRTLRLLVDTNKKPTFANLRTSQDTSVTINENEAAGTIVYQVMASDANGDTVMFYASYSSVECQAMFFINPSGIHRNISINR